jgi:hypothetical protein
MDAVAIAIGQQTVQEKLDTNALVASLTLLQRQLLANSAQLGGQAIPTESGTLNSIDIALNLIANHLSRIADNNKSIADSLLKIDINGRAQVAAMNTNNQWQAVAAISQMNKNDFDRALTEQTLLAADPTGSSIPKLPSLEERIKALLKDISVIRNISRVEGYITKGMEDSMKDIFTYVEATSLYRTVAAKFEQYKQAVLSVEFPSVATVEARLASLAGSKSQAIGGVA